MIGATADIDVGLTHSGSPWIGHVPRHWTITRFGRDIRVNEGQVDPRVEPWASMILIAPNHVESGTSRILGLESAKEQGADSGKYVVRAGQLVYSKIRPALNKVAIAPQECLCSADMYPISGNPSVVDHRFLVYWMLARPFVTFASLTSNRVKMPKINREELGGAPWARPPLEEQRRIADFLDHETAQIDALIVKQEQLIETLRERRQAVLDTEFEALEAKRVQLRRGIRFLTSGSRGWGDYYADEGERFLRIGNLPRINLNLRGDIQYVQIPPGVTEGSRTRLRRDDLLFSITAYLGSVAVVTGEWVGAYVSQHVALCRLDPSAFDSQFVGYFMLTTEGQDQLKLGAAGGTKVQLALDDIKALSVPLVPLPAQRKIVASIEVQVARIDALIAKAEEFIGLARERRAALITEAVTGRVDLSTGKARGGA